jgi:hypothetical protein
MKFMKNLAGTLFFSIFLIVSISGQTTSYDKVKALNNYVYFSNESTHGLLIVHRLLENFNKNINKFVDLPDQQINFYSNKDLPKDIFEDPENWFYDISPNEWYNELIASKGVLPDSIARKLNVRAGNMKTIIGNVNNLRFELENLIQTLDLTKRENLSTVYEKMEAGVAFYRNFYNEQMELEQEIKQYYKTLNINNAGSQFPGLLESLDGVYQTNRRSLTALYNKDDNDFNDLIAAQQRALDAYTKVDLASFKSTRLNNDRITSHWNNVKRQTGESIKSCRLFADAENVPDDYKLYDKYYYYYNISVINKFNKYGNGIVVEINRIFDLLGIPVLRYFEMPHYFKVVYPKLLEKSPFLAASDPVVSIIPKTVKGRNVVIATRTIKADSAIVAFRMYDHKIVDNDVVSLSFNGDWIVEKFIISQKPYEFSLKLNDKGKNFLLLYADDMGRQPPATIALSYMYKGKKETIVLNSDTVKSEVIEIILADK